MIKYKLLKDLPTFKVGDLFYISQYGDLIHDDGDVVVTAYTRQVLDMFPNILAEWFEEIKEEPTDSIHWKPKNGDEYFYISDYGDVYSDIWSGNSIDNKRLALGAIYRTEKECKKAHDYELTEVRLRRTSTFKPDFEDDNGGWIVVYNYRHHEMFAQYVNFEDAGESVRYKTKGEAERSIKENKKDWLIYFGIKKGEQEECRR